jgi:DNA-binding response OmpR family regulator
MAEKILLVDDDVHLLRLLAEYLRGEGFEVETVTSGAEALKQAYRMQPDLVVLDVVMPGMDGWETCARLRELSDVPIILMSGRKGEADVLRGFRLGVDDYVPKPVSAAELAARIRAVLARSQAALRPVDQVYRIGDLMVDLGRRRVMLGGEVVGLTPTEFRLLACLAQQEGRVVDDEKLAQEAWGTYKQEDTDSVRRIIWLLRQKLEDRPSEPKRILTVRGFGYRLATRPLGGTMRDEGGRMKDEE